MKIMICEICKIEFKVTKTDLKRNRKCCSRKCKGIFSRSGKDISCLFCECIFYAQKYLLDKGLGKFCSRSCGAKHRYKGSIIENICRCGKIIKSTVSRDNDGRGKYCSKKCYALYHQFLPNKGSYKLGRKNPNKGKKRPEFSGPKHPRWTGRGTENSLIRCSFEYKQWRRDVFARDKYKCVLCGDGGHLNADHIKSFSKFPSLRLELSNGRTLCIDCHRDTVNFASGKHIVVAVTGAAGFIGSYVCCELLDRGYTVIGIDDYSKYGLIKRPQDNHPKYKLIEMDLSENEIPEVINPHYIIHCAAKIGGIRYFNKYPSSLMLSNALIDTNVISSAIKFYTDSRLRRIVVMSSSMVYEGCDKYHKITGISPWPSKEDSTDILPVPESCYGFSKLNTEFLCKAASHQYGLPFVIIRPFNASGIGEEDALGDSHVIPDLVWKSLKNPENFSILGDGNQRRCFTHARDIAVGTICAMESILAEDKTFNISVNKETRIEDLAKMIWDKCNPDKKYNPIYEKAWSYDVQRRVPDTSKARNILGFNTTISLEKSVDEVIKEIKIKIEEDNVSNSTQS